MTKGDKELALAEAEAKRLKSDALNVSGGRYVLALEMAERFSRASSGTHEYTPCTAM